VALAARLRSDGPVVLLVVEIDGEVVGGIQYAEEDDPQYRHAGGDSLSSAGKTSSIAPGTVR
jgi:hypothetical protein